MPVPEDAIEAQPDVEMVTESVRRGGAAACKDKSRRK